MPMATGMSVRPVSFRRRLSSRARRCVSPQALEIPKIWNSGLCRASPTAKASSISLPMSVSMIIFSVAFARDADVSVCADTEELQSMQTANTAVTKRTLAPCLRQLRHPVCLINRYVGKNYCVYERMRVTSVHHKNTHGGSDTTHHSLPASLARCSLAGNG